jgi:hypothetical protein
MVLKFWEKKIFPRKIKKLGEMNRAFYFLMTNAFLDSKTLRLKKSKIYSAAVFFCG